MGEFDDFVASTASGIFNFILPIVVGVAWGWFWFSCAEDAYNGGEIFDIVMGVLGIAGCIWWMYAAYSSAQKEKEEQRKRAEQYRQNQMKEEERRKNREKREKEAQVAFNTCDKCGKKDAMVFKKETAETSKVMKYVKPGRDEYFSPHYVYGDEIIRTKIFECKYCGAQKSQKSTWHRWDDGISGNATSVRKVD